MEPTCEACLAFWAKAAARCFFLGKTVARISYSCREGVDAVSEVMMVSKSKMECTAAAPPKLPNWTLNCSYHVTLHFQNALLVALKSVMLLLLLLPLQSSTHSIQTPSCKHRLIVEQSRGGLNGTERREEAHQRIECRHVAVCFDLEKRRS